MKAIAQRLLRARVPGKVMLIGEYAVLDGGRSLALALDQYLELELSFAPDTQALVELHSDHWHEARNVCETLPPANFFEHVVLAAFKDLSPRGLKLRARSGWPLSAGWGSSSALCLATFLLAQHLKENASLDEEGRQHLSAAAAAAQRSFQGFASGYDIATQLQGGLVSFSATETKRLPCIPARLYRSLLLFHGKQGAPTKSVGTSTRSWLTEQALFPALHRLSAAIYELFIAFLCAEDDAALSPLIRKVAEHRALFQAAPNFPLTLAQGLCDIPGLDHSWTYKTTGAGGEDTVLILLSPLAPCQQIRTRMLALGWQEANYALNTTGSSCEEIWHA